GNRMFGRLNSLNAVIVLSTTPGLEVYQWKRAPKVQWYVHIPHAASEICLYRMFGIDYYDAVLLSGQYQADDIRALEALRDLPAKELEFIGIPYMDEMAKAAGAADEAESAAPAEGAGTAAPAQTAEPAEKTVLLAPSWGSSAILSVYGGKIIDVLLNTGRHVIVRPHPQSFTAEKDLMERLMREYPPSDRLEWNRDLDNSAVLKRADIMVSDFSGVIFDFALIYNKPVIYTDPDIDLSPYDAWWLNKPLWTAGALPKLGQRLTEENMPRLKELIDECLTDPRFAEGRKQVREETWLHPGEGAKRAANYLCAKYEALAGKEGSAE
ncbi:MAG: CDP-glycerol glycerophosphotransferase family protein, partial [Lachnospiraceae bacterium]|nr:CDP-glycerol glycerophosphotransferase family protein [Lachnospiraceae bacterium]